MGGPKRRLAASLGEVAAWRIYRAMSASLLRSLADPRWRTVLAVTPDDAVGLRAPDIWPATTPRVPQGAGGLGPRLARAFDRKGPTIVVGTDAPDVRASDVWAGFRALQRADAVFGPAVDGGFWLMGLARPVTAARLAAVRWSSPDALADTVDALGRVRRVRFLRVLRDVDDGADWRAVNRVGQARLSG